MNQLTKRIISSPSMWHAAAQVAVAKFMRCDEVTVKRSGLRLCCGTRNGQGSFCAVDGLGYEPELRWLLNQLQPGDTFVDVGANIGIYSLHAARKLKGSGSVLSMEPSPDAIRLLKRNIALNGFEKIVTAVHAAASNKDGELYLAGDPTRWNSLQLHEGPPGVPICVTTVDHLLTDFDKGSFFHFLKIDAEGVESEVLEGARDSIQTTWPSIIFENSINRSNMLPTTWLCEKGYQLCTIDRTGRLSEVAAADYKLYINLIAVHRYSKISRGYRGE